MNTNLQNIMDELYKPLSEHEKSAWVTPEEAERIFSWLDNQQISVTHIIWWVKDEVSSVVCWKAEDQTVASSSSKVLSPLVLKAIEALKNTYWTRDLDKLYPKLITQSRDIDARNKDWDTALIMAVSCSKKALIPILLEAWADFKAVNKEWKNAFMAAKTSFDVFPWSDLTREVFYYMKDLNRAYANPEILALRKYLKDMDPRKDYMAHRIADAIKMACWDINALDDKWWSALKYSVLCMDYDLAIKCMVCGADPKFKRWKGSSALDDAKREVDQRMLEILNIKDIEQFKKQWKAISSLDDSWQDSLKEFWIKMKSGESLDYKDTDGMTALMKCAYFWLYVRIWLFADAWANLDAQDNNRKTALIHATIANHPNCVEALLNSWANPRLKDKFWKDALWYAKGLVEMWVKIDKEIITMLTDAK